MPDTQTEPRSRPFEERAAWEKGFDELFRERLAPKLEDIEGRRASQWRKRSRFSKGVLGLSIVVCAVSLTTPFYTTAWPAFLFLGVVLSLIGLGAAAMLHVNADRAHREMVTQLVLPPTIEFVGGIDKLEKCPRIDDFKGFEKMTDMGLVPYHTTVAVDVLIRGSFRQIPYELAEVSLTRKEQAAESDGEDDASSPTESAFSGLMLSIDHPLDSPQPIVILTADAVAPSSDAELPDEIEEFTFEKGPLAETVRVIAPSLDDALTALPALHHEAIADWLETLGDATVKLALTAAGVHALIAAPDDRFGASTLSESLEDIDVELHQLLAELTLPRRLIEALPDDSTS